jgi:hypothetical protein
LGHDGSAAGASAAATGCRHDRKTSGEQSTSTHSPHAAAKRINHIEPLWTNNGKRHIGTARLGFSEEHSLTQAETKVSCCMTFPFDDYFILCQRLAGAGLPA